MQQWEKIADKPVDINHWMPLFTLDVLGVTVLSRNFNAMKGEESEDIEALNIVLGNSTKPKILILGMVRTHITYLYLQGLLVKLTCDFLCRSRESLVSTWSL